MYAPDVPYWVHDRRKRKRYPTPKLEPNIFVVSERQPNSTVVPYAFVYGLMCPIKLPDTDRPPSPDICWPFPNALEFLKDQAGAIVVRKNSPWWRSELTEAQVTFYKSREELMARWNSITGRAIVVPGEE